MNYNEYCGASQYHLYVTITKQIATLLIRLLALSEGWLRAARLVLSKRINLSLTRGFRAIVMPLIMVTSIRRGTN